MLPHALKTSDLLPLLHLDFLTTLHHITPQCQCEVLTVSLWQLLNKHQSARPVCLADYCPKTWLNECKLHFPQARQPEIQHFVFSLSSNKVFTKSIDSIQAMYMCLFYLHNFDGCLAGGVGVRIICGGLDSATLGAFFFLRMADGAESLSSSESDDSDSNSCCLCTAFCDGLKQQWICM